jgi:hypothetical protein
VSDETKYPKIETLLERGEDGGITSKYRRAEFGLVPRWAVYEKVDGTNIRVTIGPALPGVTVSGEPLPSVKIGGRTANAQIPTKLLAHLQEILPPPEKLRDVFGDAGGEPFVIYGEGYGPGIQNGGAYASGPGFRIFDVRCGHIWLEQDDVDDIAAKLGILRVPFLGFHSTATACALAHGDQDSIVAKVDGGTGRKMEGVVARAYPTLLDRLGKRVMWKLKARDFKEPKA